MRPTMWNGFGGAPVAAALAVWLAAPLPAASRPTSGGAAAHQPWVATFSIVAYDSVTGDLGVAVQSKFFAVGAVVPWARAGVGAIATQAFANTTFGARGLELLAQGLAPQVVLDSLLAGDPQREQRQVGIVNARGAAAAHTGSACMAWAGHAGGTHFTAQGNILVGKETVEAMARAFRSTAGMLGDKLVGALEAGQAAGGDSRGQQSAALLIVRAGAGYGGYDDRYCDLRVDDHAAPIAELRRLYEMWKGWALVSEGYRLCEAQRWEDAFAAGHAAVALHPDEGEPWYHLACYFSKAGQGTRALESLSEALQRDPSLAARARKDTDFEPLWKNADFIALTEP